MKERNTSIYGICAEGIPYVAFCALCSVVFALLSWGMAAVFFVILTFFVMNFFRDPQRIAPQEKGVVLSPADGRVVKIGPAVDPFTGEKRQRISVFMNVFNVHVNRAPVASEVVEIRYIKGRFLNASLDKASADNERNLILLRDDEGNAFTVVQIAGLIARRIVCWVEKGERLLQGERLGLIKFGSRVDLYLPEGYEVDIRMGEKVLAGLDVIARKSQKE